MSVLFFLSRSSILCFLMTKPSFPSGAMVKNPPANAEDARERVQSLGREGPLEEGMATHSSIVAWETPWTEEPGGLQSMGSQRAGHH